MAKPDIAPYRFVALGERMLSARRAGRPLLDSAGDDRELLLQAIRDRRPEAASARLRLLSLAASHGADAELDAQLSSVVMDEDDDPRARLGALTVIARNDRSQVAKVLDRVLNGDGPAWLGLAAAQHLVGQPPPGLGDALARLDARLLELAPESEPSRRYLKRLIDQLNNPTAFDDDEPGIVD
ncbi:MAG: hypothetical protein AAF560_29585 [Acidobacteriota bacterium]